MTKDEDILKPFEVIERQILEVENVVEKNKDFTILFFSQLYTQLDTCQKFHPFVFAILATKMPFLCNLYIIQFARVDTNTSTPP